MGHFLKLVIIHGWQQHAVANIKHKTGEHLMVCSPLLVSPHYTSRLNCFFCRPRASSSAGLSSNALLWGVMNQRLLTVWELKSTLLGCSTWSRRQSCWRANKDFVDDTLSPKYLPSIKLTTSMQYVHPSKLGLHESALIPLLKTMSTEEERGRMAIVHFSCSVLYISTPDQIRVDSKRWISRHKEPHHKPLNLRSFIPFCHKFYA